MSPLRVELWDWDMVGKNDFLGMVSIPPTNERLLCFPSASNEQAGEVGLEDGCSMASLGSGASLSMGQAKDARTCARPQDGLKFPGYSGASHLH